MAFQFERPIVCVQGLGFVGTAMAIAIANARSPQGLAYFNVIGIDVPSADGIKKIDSLNQGKLYFQSADENLNRALKKALETKNLIATSDSKSYTLASIIVIDLPFDIADQDPAKEFRKLRLAVKTIGEHVKEETLVFIETTLPPGTCEKIIIPEIQECCHARGIGKDAIHFAYSYERVMPGPFYLDSIIKFWRAYAGYTSYDAKLCESFLSKIIDVKTYPLARLASLRAAETAKVLENSFRAINIAFIEEWSRFAEEIEVDLFEIISAIRCRPTHSNIKQPGFGVGGYCLPKDPMMAQWSSQFLYEKPYLTFPFSLKALEVNRQMPFASLQKLEELLGGNLKSKNILLLGVSYRDGIGDTRNSPSETFVIHAQKKGAYVICHDPYVRYWEELKIKLPSQIPSSRELDALVLAVPHKHYLDFDFIQWIGEHRLVILDANDILTYSKRQKLREKGCIVFGMGRGTL